MKRAITFYVEPEAYDRLKQLARYRALKGVKNTQGQPASVGLMMNLAIQEYLTNHADELNAFDAMTEGQKKND